jgi:membrane protein
VGFSYVRRENIAADTLQSFEYLWRMMTNLLRRLRELLWGDHEAHPPNRRPLLRAGQYVFALARDLFEGQISMRAMSLVYTTLLSLVPILALAFSLLKALGVHNTLEPVLLEFLSPLGAQASEVTRNIVGFVDQIKVGVLGTLGISLLMYSAVSLIQKVEGSFNYIWRVVRPRPLSQRIGDYLSVLMVGPVLVFSSMGLTATVLNSSAVNFITSIEPFGLLFYSFTKLLPYLLIIGAFTFLYSFIPNTRVRLKAAFGGGVLAGVLWQSSSLLFASFVAGATNYNAIYSGFAIVIFLLIWIQLGWLILLTGCQLAFYIQHPERLAPDKTAPTLSGKGVEYLALMIMSLTGQRFLKGEPGYTQEELAVKMNAAPEHVAQTVEVLMFHRLLVEAGELRSQLIPGKDLDSITLAQLWRLARAGNTPLPLSRLASATQIKHLLDSTEERFETEQADKSLRQFILEAENLSK